MPSMGNKRTTIIFSFEHLYFDFTQLHLLNYYLILF